VGLGLGPQSGQGTADCKGSVEETKKGDEMSELGSSETCERQGLKLLIFGSEWEKTAPCHDIPENKGR